MFYITVFWGPVIAQLALLSEDLFKSASFGILKYEGMFAHLKYM